jgi:hypothetical protein
MSPISIIANTPLEDAATNDDTSTVGEPSLAMANDQLFVTGNWYASRSTDAGGSWTHVDPFTALPSAAGGFCCDQVVEHDDARGVWIWILQYIEKDGANVFRLAATHDEQFPDGGWYWWDVAPTTLDRSWTNLWFDYPDVALTADNCFVTFNMFNEAGEWQRASVMRFPLQTIADAGTLGFNSWSTSDNGSLRLVQGADRTMYWASHNSGQQLRLFAWPDAQTSINWWDINVTPWSETISSTAPNGVDWLGRCDSRITGGSVGGGTITIAWTAGSGPGRPHPHCRVVRINEASKQLVDEPDLWSNNRAWAYPALSTNDSAVVGFTAFHGGADRHPGLVVGARDDAAGSWTSTYAKQGSNSPSDAKWGDYLTCRTHSSTTSQWVAAGYTLEGGQTRQDVLPRVVRFELASG